MKKDESAGSFEIRLHTVLVQVNQDSIEFFFLFLRMEQGEKPIGQISINPLEINCIKSYSREIVA